MASRSASHAAEPLGLQSYRLTIPPDISASARQPRKVSARCLIIPDRAWASETDASVTRDLGNGIDWRPAVYLDRCALNQSSTAALLSGLTGMPTSCGELAIDRDNPTIADVLTAMPRFCVVSFTQQCCRRALSYDAQKQTADVIDPPLGRYLPMRMGHERETLPDLFAVPVCLGLASHGPTFPILRATLRAFLFSAVSHHQWQSWER